jgi:hypothetical protein
MTMIHLDARLDARLGVGVIDARTVFGRAT